MTTATPIDSPSSACADASPPMATCAQTIADVQRSKAMRPVLLFALTMAALVIGLWTITQNEARLLGSDELTLPVSNEITPPLSVQSAKSDEPVASAKVGIVKEVPVAWSQAATKNAKAQGSPIQASAADKLAKPGLQSPVNAIGGTNSIPTGPSSLELNKLVIDAINK